MGGGGGDAAVPKCGSWDRVEFVYRQRLSKTLGLDRPDRDLYARMLVIPSFEGEKSVSLFGPGPEGALTVVVAESEDNLWTASFEELRRSNRTIDELIELPLGAGVELREAPLDEVTGMRVVAAFDAFLRQARYPDRFPILADPTIYESTGLLVGFGEACARLQRPLGKRTVIVYSRTNELLTGFRSLVAWVMAPPLDQVREDPDQTQRRRLSAKEGSVGLATGHYWQPPPTQIPLPRAS